jgi:predicted RNA-binding Zn-ribbon protein involved in translation (DUF1610 family)
MADKMKTTCCDEIAVENPETKDSVCPKCGRVITKASGSRKSKYPEKFGLLSGVNALTSPDWHRLNAKTHRNDRLLHAVLCAYAKHHLDCEDIGWDQLGEILCDVICNEIGDVEFQRWLERMK